MAQVMDDKEVVDGVRNALANRINVSKVEEDAKKYAEGLVDWNTGQVPNKWTVSSISPVLVRSQKLIIDGVVALGDHSCMIKQHVLGYRQPQDALVNVQIQRERIPAPWISKRSKQIDGIMAQAHEVG